ncbi:MAG: prepilin peptidase [Pedobacter sp.]|nr:MAG: prepilin peptidase [Pedobacter sp.]
MRFSFTEIPDLFLNVFVVVFGLFIGSFLNVVIYRVPRGESIAYPGSHCPQCNGAIRFYDNIPVLSYLILLGKCRHCKKTK